MMNTSPMIDDSRIVSPTMTAISASETNGERKTRLLTCAVVRGERQRPHPEHEGYAHLEDARVRRPADAAKVKGRRGLPTRRRRW